MSAHAVRVRRKPVKLILLGVAAFAMFMVASMGYAPETSAAQCRDNGRECGYGYFTNRGPTPSGNNMFTPANLGLYANNLNDLYGGLGGKMQCRNAGQPGSTFGVPQNDQNATSAAFIVLTMLGAPPGTAKNQACERWTEWTELVAGYDRAGRIHYNEYHDFDCINTLYTRVNADAVYYAECGAAQSIVFYGANGAPIYAIKRDCANPVGRVI